MPARALGFASGITIPGNIDLTQFVGAMVGNITAANTNIVSLQSNITATNSAIITANTGMKTYVDTAVASAVIQASGYGNAVVAVYLPINPTINSIQANITAANLNITSLQSNITAANLNITSLQSNITAANLNITSLQSNITAANANIVSLQSNITAANTKIQFMTANVGGSVFTNNVYLGEGNLVVGNINASGNLVMRGIDATTIRFVRSPDTTVTAGEIYGNIDFAGEDSSNNAAGVRARISVAAATTYSDLGEAEIKFYTTDGYFVNAYPVAPTLLTNARGYFGPGAGFNSQIYPTFTPSDGVGPEFEPRSNDSTASYITGLYTSSVGKTYAWNNTGFGPTSSFNETEIAQTFLHSYAGFAGGDRANVNLSAYLAPTGGYPIITADNGHTDLEITVQGVYTADPAAATLTQKRLRKQWVATISYSTTTGLWTILDQQLRTVSYNSDGTNWAAGAVNAGKVLLQANATVGSQALYLRMDSPTSAAVTSTVKWQWTVKYRTILST